MPRSTFGTPPPDALSRKAALLSLSGTGAFVALLAALHVLRPDLDPSWRFISEYELGEHGWLMRAAFLGLAIGTGSVAVAVAPQARSAMGYAGILQLALSAAGMILAALFVPDAGSRLHEVGAMLDQVPFAALCIAWSLSRNERWAQRRGRLWAVAFLPLLGLAVFTVSMGIMLPRHGGRPGPAVLVGWQNRFMILTQCAWIVHTARQIRAFATGGVGESSARRW